MTDVYDWWDDAMALARAVAWSQGRRTRVRAAVGGGWLVVDAVPLAR